jgi:hypothetical protein
MTPEACQHDWVCSLCGETADEATNHYNQRLHRQRQLQDEDDHRREQQREREAMAQRLSDARLRKTHEQYGTAKLLPDWMGRD